TLPLASNRPHCSVGRSALNASSSTPATTTPTLTSCWPSSLPAAYTSRCHRTFRTRLANVLHPAPCGLRNVLFLLSLGRLLQPAGSSSRSLALGRPRVCSTPQADGTRVPCMTTHPSSVAGWSPEAGEGSKRDGVATGGDDRPTASTFAPAQPTTTGGRR